MQNLKAPAFFRQAKKKFCINTPTLAFTALFMSVIFISCGKKEPDREQSVINVQTGEVITKTIPTYIDSFGTFSASENVDIKSQISGQKIKKIYFKEGSFVKKGELLISLEDDIYKASLEIDQATVAQDMEDLKLQESILERDKNLYEKGSLPKQTYEKMLTDYLNLKTKLKSDIARVEIDKINLGYCSITSPINGVIGYIKVDEGNTVYSSDILANVKNIDPLYIDFNIPSKELFSVQEELRNNGKVNLICMVSAKNNLNEQNNLVLDGALYSLNNQADSNSSTARLRGVVPNSDNRVLPGLFANIKVSTGEIKDALLIPSEGLMLDNDKHYFFRVDKQDKAERILVDVIGIYANYFIAKDKDSIKPGDKIIVSGLLDILPGQKVTIREKSALQNKLQ